MRTEARVGENHLTHFGIPAEVYQPPSEPGGYETRLMNNSATITQSPPSGQNRQIGSVATRRPVVAGTPAFADHMAFASHTAPATTVITYGIWKPAHKAITRRGAHPL